jgi:hypothetical protein
LEAETERAKPSIIGSVAIPVRVKVSKTVVDWSGLAMVLELRDLRIIREMEGFQMSGDGRVEGL